MTEDVEIILHLPLPDMDGIGIVLCNITKALHSHDPELVHHGFLGGSFGYGGDWSSSVFYMRPDSDYDCDCGHESAEWNWIQSHPHADDCYQSAVTRECVAAGAKVGQWGHLEWPDYNKGTRIHDSVMKKLCKKMGLPWPDSSWVHCTCSHEKAYAAWCAANSHKPTCATVLPNFKHHASGFEVRWYKYIGRGMEVVGAPPDLRTMEAECIADVKAEGDC